MDRWTKGMYHRSRPSSGNRLRRGRKPRSTAAQVQVRVLGQEEQKLPQGQGQGPERVEVQRQEGVQGQQEAVVNRSKAEDAERLARRQRLASHYRSAQASYWEG